MTMTLIDVRDWHRTRELSFARQQSPQLSDEHKQMADAIDAHLAGMGEPVAWQYRELGKPWRTVSRETYDRYCVGSGYECRTLFAAPPASGDWDAEIKKLQNALAKHVDRVCGLQSRLAAADVLLRECSHYLSLHHYTYTIKRIDAHLQSPIDD